LIEKLISGLPLQAETLFVIMKKMPAILKKGGKE